MRSQPCPIPAASASADRQLWRVRKAGSLRSRANVLKAKPGAADGQRVVRKLLIVALNVLISVGLVAVACLAAVASVTSSSFTWNESGWVGGFLVLGALLMLVLAIAHVPLCVTRHQPTLGARLLRHSN